MKTEGDDTELLDNLHSLPKESSASRPNPSTSHGRRIIHDDLSGSHIAEQVQEVNDVDMALFSVACQWLHCKTCATCCQV